MSLYLPLLNHWKIRDSVGSWLALAFIFLYFTLKLSEVGWIDLAIAHRPRRRSHGHGRQASRIPSTELHDVFPCAFPCLGLRLNLVETESALISALTQAIAVSRLLSCLLYFTLFLLNQSDRSHLTDLTAGSRSLGKSAIATQLDDAV